MSTAATFRYRPLSGDIRLVILRQGSGSDPITCELIDIEFAAKQNYLALSYEWGAARNKNYLISVNGLRHYVRRNLYEALEHLRQPVEDLIIWIDALCINQQNIIERNLQVQLMGEIYGRASKVVIWLGPTRDNSDLAITQLEKMSLAVLQGKPIGRMIATRQRFTESTDFPEIDGSLEIKRFLRSLHLDAIASWCNRTYWRRMWVIQEIQLAKQLYIYCGTDQISWCDFSRARKYITHWREPFQPEREVFESMRFGLPARMDELREKGSTRQIPLIDWLEAFEASMCTDPKDKVYALIGLASDCQNSELVVDYSKSMSQVYFDVLGLYFQDKLNDPECSEGHTASVLRFSHCLSKWLGMDSGDDRSVEVYNERLPREHVWIRSTYCGPIAATGQDFAVSPSEVAEIWAGRPSERVPIASKRLGSVRPIDNGMSSEVRFRESKGYLNDAYGWLFGCTKGHATRQIKEGDQELIFLNDGGGFKRGDSALKDVVHFRTVITEYGETVLVPPSTNREDLICLLPECDIALIFRRFPNQWILEGSGVYALLPRKRTDYEAVHIRLDIRILQKIAASAEFDRILHKGTSL